VDAASIIKALVGVAQDLNVIATWLRAEGHILKTRSVSASVTAKTKSWPHRHVGQENTLLEQRSRQNQVV